MGRFFGDMFTLHPVYYLTIDSPRSVSVHLRTVEYGIDAVHVNGHWLPFGPEPSNSLIHAPYIPLRPHIEGRQMYPGKRDIRSQPAWWTHAVSTADGCVLGRVTPLLLPPPCVTINPLITHRNQTHMMQQQYHTSFQSLALALLLVPHACDSRPSGRQRPQRALTGKRPSQNKSSITSVVATPTSLSYRRK